MNEETAAADGYRVRAVDDRGSDCNKNYAAVKILSTVTDRLEYELNRRRMEREEGAVHPPVKLPDERFKNGVLSGVDLTKTLTREEYKERLDKLQKKLEVLHGELYRLRIPVVIGFEAGMRRERRCDPAPDKPPGSTRLQGQSDGGTE